MALGICAGCRRFARGARCPFCGASVGPPLAREPGRRARNALYRESVLAAAAIAIACGGTTTPDKDASDDGSSDAREDWNAQPPYGIAPMDAGKDARDAS